MQVTSDKVKACDQAVNNSMNTVLLTIVAAQLLLSVHDVNSYKILLIPSTIKSHVFSLAAIAEGLTDRGHDVTFFVHTGFQLNQTGVKDWTKINVVRYKNSVDGVPMDEDNIDDNITRSLMEPGAGFFRMASLVKEE